MSIKFVFVTVRSLPDGQHVIREHITKIDVIYPLYYQIDRDTSLIALLIQYMFI